MSKVSILIMSFITFVLLYISLTISLQQSSPLKQFNVTPDILYLNWTNNYTSNITITMNKTFNNITVQIMNDTITTSNVVGNYSQSNSAKTQCKPSYYHLFVKNEGGDYNNTIGPITNATSNSTNVTILDTDIEYDHTQCSPGRYWIEKLTIRNITRTNETANITVIIDIPISSSNNNNILSTGVGSFDDTETKLPTNASTYHSYYFNTSLVTNATGVMINLTGWSSPKDIDLFLFDNSSTPVLKAKSINKTHTVESLMYSYLPSDKMWEIRVYGNYTSTIAYNGMIIFTTLNTTNSSIDFGVLNASGTNQVNITLRNEGNLTLSNVLESKELYHINKFSGNSTKNFTFLVPDSSIASKVKATLNWTGATNYSLKIYNQNDALVASSTNKYVYANVTGAMQEEYNETNTTSTAGIWKVGVKNNTNITDPLDPYNITVYTYISPTNWITTNYTTMTFNRTGNNNYTVDVQINFTVQNKSIDGLYEGYIKYLDNNKAGLKIPISFNVTTPMLVVNNSLNSETIRIDENNGTTLTRSLNIDVNNTGFYDLNVVLTNSSNDTMSCISGSCSGYFANFTYNSISSVSSRSSTTLSVNITFNSSMPTNTVYEGWIFFNATNITTALSSHPYETFNLTFRLNLTSLLDLQNLQIISTDGDTIANGTHGENVTAKFKIYYINGTTEIEAKTALNTSNFTVSLSNQNASKAYSSLTLFNGTNPIYINPYYSINFSVPADSVGGHYSVSVTATYKKNPIYNGTKINQTLIINNTGIKLIANTSTTPSVNENGASIYFNATAVNYGPLTATGLLELQNGTTNYCNIIAHEVRTPGGTCGTITVANGDTFTVAISEGEVCEYSWKITSIGGNITSDKYCYPDLLAYDLGFGNITSITITVNDVDENVTTTTTTTTSEDGAGGNGDEDEDEGEESIYLEIKTYPSTVSIEQGKNKTESVLVKNINITEWQTVTLTVTGINSSWYDIAINKKMIDPEKMYTYYVTFLIPDNATVKNYACTFKASSSFDTVSKSFTLEVTPGPEMQTDINVTLSDYESNISTLETQINQSRDEGHNTTIAESKLSELKAKFKQALEYRDVNDYKSAYELFDDIDTLLNETRTALEEAGLPSGDWWKWGKWVVVAVVGVVAIFLGYLFWPTAGYEPGKQFVIKTKREVVKDGLSAQYQKLKEKWSKIREKEEKRKQEQARQQNVTKSENQ